MTTSIVSDDDDAIETFTKLFESKRNRGDIDGKMKIEQLRKMAGRVTRGSTEADFQYLQKDTPSVKKFAWIMGDDGLSLFLERSNLDALRSIGCEDRWIRKKLENGERFRLGVFYKSPQCIVTTWPEILSLIDNCYPKAISIKIRRHEDALKQLTFDDIEERARLSYLRGASYFDINEAAVKGNSTDPRFMSEERFLECEGTLEEARGFLYNRLGLSRLFDGSGFTKDSSGKLFVREYLQFNVLVKDIRGFRYLDLPIDINDLASDA